MAQTTTTELPVMYASPDSISSESDPSATGSNTTALVADAKWSPTPRGPVAPVPLPLPNEMEPFTPIKDDTDSVEKVA